MKPNIPTLVGFRCAQHQPTTHRMVLTFICFGEARSQFCISCDRKIA